MKFVKALLFGLAAAVLASCSSAPAPVATSPPGTAAPAPAPSPLQSSAAAVQAGLDQLAQTPAGNNILLWAAGGIAQAKTAVAGFNAKLPGGGFTLAKTTALCGADNSLHALLSVALPFVPPVVPGLNPVGIDNVTHTVIQDGCALATGGTMPSIAQIEAMVSEFSTVNSALGIKF